MNNRDITYSTFTILLLAALLAACSPVATLTTQAPAANRTPSPQLCSKSLNSKTDFKISPALTDSRDGLTILYSATLEKKLG